MLSANPPILGYPVWDSPVSAQWAPGLWAHDSQALGFWSSNSQTHRTPKQWLWVYHVHSCKIPRDKPARRTNLSSIYEPVRRVQYEHGFRIQTPVQWRTQKPAKKAVAAEPHTDAGTFALQKGNYNNIWLSQLLSDTQNKLIVKKE